MIFNSSTFQQRSKNKIKIKNKITIMMGWNQLIYVMLLGYSYFLVRNTFHIFVSDIFTNSEKHENSLCSK